MKPMKFGEAHRLLVNVTVGFFIFLGIMAVIVFIARKLTHPTTMLPPASLPSLHFFPSLPPATPDSIPYNNQ